LAEALSRHCGRLDEPGVVHVHDHVHVHDDVVPPR
jgi:hypothetical protein